MRALLVAALLMVPGCLRVEAAAEGGVAPARVPWTVALELDRMELPATGDLAGTIVLAPDPSRSRDERGAAPATVEVRGARVEFANEQEPLLDLVVEDGTGGALPRPVPADRATRFRFRLAPCAAFAERSARTPVALQRLGPGNHALRIVLDVADDANPSGQPPWNSSVPLNSFASRWTSFDVADTGRPLDADDLESIVSSMEERRAADVLFVFGLRVLGPERLVAIVARASGLRRGHFAEVVARQVTVGQWQNHEAWQAYRSLFAEVEEAGLDCSSHAAPPLFHRIAVGRIVPVRNGTAETHNFKMLRVGGDVTANFVLPPNRSVDTRNAVWVPGLFRVTCDMHPGIWGWLLVE
jgi:hypothetical protein